MSSLRVELGKRAFGKRGGDGRILYIGLKEGIHHTEGNNVKVRKLMQIGC